MKLFVHKNIVKLVSPNRDNTLICNEIAVTIVKERRYSLFHRNKNLFKNQRYLELSIKFYFSMYSLELFVNLLESSKLSFKKFSLNLGDACGHLVVKILDSTRPDPDIFSSQPFLCGR